LSVGSSAKTGSGPKEFTEGRLAAFVAIWAAVNDVLRVGSTLAEIAGILPG